MPIPAFGNGQELALLLDEYWSDHPELQNIPIYFASGLFQRGMRVYKTYVHTMNAHIRARFARRDTPFDFKYVKWLKTHGDWMISRVLVSSWPLRSS